MVSWYSRRSDVRLKSLLTGKVVAWPPGCVSMTGQSERFDLRNR